MEPPQPEQFDSQQPFDFGFGAVAAKPLQTNGTSVVNDEDVVGYATSLLEPMNGRHRPKPPKYNDNDDDDDEDDDDEDEEEEEDDDLGPETNVDVTDESHEDFGKLDQAMGHNYPDEFLIKMPAASATNDVVVDKQDVQMDFEMDNKQSELIAEADNVADSEESEDEWNFYRPEDQQKSSSSSKPDRCEEEREACSPSTEQQQLQIQPEVSVEIIESTEDNDNRPQSSGTDDVTAEYDEIHETEAAEKEPVTLPFEHPLDNKDVEVEPEVATAPLLEQLEEQQKQPELIEEPELFSDEDMESPLNPDAKEFVPSSPGSPPPVPPQLSQMSSDLVAGSPLKQNQRALKNCKIPSEEEFQEEICRRPSEIGDVSSDFSNNEASPNATSTISASLIGGFDDDRQKTILMNLDDSEVSSTKAEFGDESTYSVASEFYKTGVDCSYTGSERGEFDAMATSMTPSDFKQAFEQEPDLNKVHELKDEDLLGMEVQNGVHLHNDVDDDEHDEKPKAPQSPIMSDHDELLNDVENFDLQQQSVSVEVFSAVVDEHVSSYDNDDLLMNMRNTEQSKEELPTATFANPFTTVETMKDLTEGMEKVNLDMEVDEKPLAEAVMMNPLALNFGASRDEQKVEEAIMESPVKEPEIMSGKYEEENLISRSTEALREEFKTETETAFDKPNHVEDLSPLSDQMAEPVKTDKLEEFVHEMHVDEPGVKPINLSESLQEFTGLEEQLSPQSHQVKDNMCFEEVPTLKESLVDEPKDVEEVTPSFVTETKDVPLSNDIIETKDVPLSNEITETKDVPLSNEIPEKEAAPIVEVAATVAAAVAATTAVAAATAKPSKPSSAAKTQKPAATAISKVGSKVSPTSPSKPGVAAKASGTAAKKPALTAASKTKPATTTAASRPAASSLLNKTAASRTTTTAAKTAASTTAKPAPRTSTVPSAPKPRLNSVTSKIGSADKKPTTNGDVKPAAAKPTPIARSTLSKPPASSTASKTSSLVKTSTTPRMSLGSTTTAASKTRPTSSSTASKTSTTSKLNPSGVTSSTTASRPKTAPATSTSTGAAKSKIGTKSPMIDKQIKETANKQISSARTSSAATAPKPRLTTGTTTTTTKRMSLAPKPAASPAKKPSGGGTTTKTAVPKTNAMSKANSKVSSTTTKTSAIEKTEIVQNGICQSSDEGKISTTTTTTTANIEEDIPMKDVSPIEPLTDNQLITAE